MQARIAAVTDDVMRFTWAAGNGRSGFQPAFADGRLDVVIGRIAFDARVAVIGA